MNQSSIELIQTPIIIEQCSSTHSFSGVSRNWTKSNQNSIKLIQTPIIRLGSEIEQNRTANLLSGVRLSNQSKHPNQTNNIKCDQTWSKLIFPECISWHQKVWYLKNQNVRLNCTSADCLIIKSWIVFDWANIVVSWIMFDYQTQLKDWCLTQFDCQTFNQIP